MNKWFKIRLRCTNINFNMEPHFNRTDLEIKRSIFNELVSESFCIVFVEIEAI